MRRTRLAAAALTLVAACGDSGKSTGPNGGPLTLEPSAQVSRRIGAGADTLRATSSTGARYSLGFDSGAVLDTVTVRMTPVTSAASGPLHDAHLIAAVRMEPSGTVFAHPAQLTIELPAGTNVARLAGFLSDGDGSAPHLVPVRVEGNTATLLVPHFSVAGLVDDASQIPPPSPSAGAAAAEARLGDYLWTEASAGHTPLPDSLIAILDDWYLDVVRPDLLAAAQPGATDLATVIALDEADTWAGYLDISASAAATVRAGLGADIRDAESNVGAALRAAIARANQTCLAQPTTLLGMTNAMRAANNAFFWDLFGAPASLSVGRPMPLQTLVDSLCLKINYLSVTFPQQVLVGQTVPFVVRAGMLLGSQSVTTTDLLDIDVQPAGAIVAAGQPASGGNDANGFFSTQLTIQQAATVVNVHSCANTQFAAQQLSYLQFLCKDTLIVRNGGGIGTDLSGPWTGLVDNIMTEVMVSHDQATGRVTATFVGSSNSSQLVGSFAGTLSVPRLQNFSLGFNLFCLTTYTAPTVNATTRQIDGTATGPDCSGVGTRTTQFRWVKLNGAPIVQGNYVCNGCADGVIGRADVIQFGDSLYIDAGPGRFASRLNGSTFSGTLMTIRGGTVNCLLGGSGCTLDPTSTITGSIGGGTISGTVTTPQGTFQLLATKM